MLSGKGRLASLCLFTLLVGCAEEEPIKVGFIGGTSGRVADLGTAGRNGFTLALEEQNALGGINGRKIHPIYKDDQQQPALAQTLIDELIAEEVDAIIGPMTSAMAVATVDQINQAETLMMACTVTTDQLTGIDDYFMRPLSAISEHSGKLAKLLNQYEPEASKAVAILDFGNRAYTESWLQGFKKTFESNGGELVATETYISGADSNFVGIANAALNHNPSLILLSMNSVDAALITKQIRVKNPDLIIASSEWAGTERLIELGGIYTENMYVPQYINRSSNDIGFINFKTTFEKRFKNAPGFPGLFCYEAARMVFQGMQSDEKDLKQAMLNLNSYQGVQGPLKLDAYGDGKSKTFVTRVEQGKFVVLE